MNINEEIQKATDSFIESKLPDLVSQKVGKMIDDVLSQTFSNYSDVAKSIKTKIEQNLDINLQKFDLIDYNHLVSKAITDRLSQIVNEQSIVPIMKMVESSVGYLEKKKWKLSEIHEMVIEDARSDSSESEGKISFHVEQNEKHEWYNVSIDIEENKSPNECGIEFCLGREGSIFLFKSRSHWSNKGRITPIKLTQLSNLEHKIFRLYSAQVKIEVDEVDFYNDWSNID